MKKTSLLKKLDKSVGGTYIRLLSSAKPSDLGKVSNVLIIKTVAIGDLVLLLPAIKAIKEIFPQARLTLLTTPRVREVVESLPFIDDIIYYDILGKDNGLSGLRNIIRRIRDREFDLSIDFEHYYNFTAIICRLAGIKNMAGFTIGKQPRQKLFSIKIPYNVDKHEVEAFFEAVEVLSHYFHPPLNPLPSREGKEGQLLSLVKVSSSDEDRHTVEQFLSENEIFDEDLLVAVHPGTSDSAKVRRWLPERFAEVINSLVNDYKAKVVITSTSDDKEVIDEILRGQSPLNWTGDSPRQRSTVNGQLIICTNFTLKQTALLFKRCNLVISVDTGPMHIAAAMGTKTIGLFGPNTPDKWGPYGFTDLAVYKELDCSPCTNQYLGQISKCRTGECMQAITVNDVLENVKKVLSLNRQPCPPMPGSGRRASTVN